MRLRHSWTNALSVDSSVPENRTESELAAVYRLLEKCSLPTEGVADQFGDNWAIVIEGDEAVAVAAVEVHGADGLLRSVAVDPGKQRDGLGSQIVRDRIAWAKTLGLETLYLLTTTAAAFFPRFGFVQVSRESAPPAMQGSREFRETCPASAVVMRLDLK